MCTLNSKYRSPEYSSELINGYVFDGAENYCASVNDEAVVAYAAENTTTVFGIEMQVKTWPEQYS
eukprot:787780-Karenia_brevis.AAC.1